MKPCPKAEMLKAIGKSSVLIHSKIAFGLFPRCFQCDYVFNAFFIASLSNRSASSQLLKIRKCSPSPAFCEIPCDPNLPTARKEIHHRDTRAERSAR